MLLHDAAQLPATMDAQFPVPGELWNHQCVSLTRHDLSAKMIEQTFVDLGEKRLVSVVMYGSKPPLAREIAERQRSGPTRRQGPLLRMEIQRHSKIYIQPKLSIRNPHFAQQTIKSRRQSQG